jgi:hypothetical protein
LIAQLEQKLQPEPVLEQALESVPAQVSQLALAQELVLQLVQVLE